MEVKKASIRGRQKREKENKGKRRKKNNALPLKRQEVVPITTPHKPPTGSNAIYLLTPVIKTSGCPAM